jgi:hypothetical protein
MRRLVRVDTSRFLAAAVSNTIERHVSSQYRGDFEPGRFVHWVCADAAGNSSVAGASPDFNDGGSMASAVG